MLCTSILASRAGKMEKLYQNELKRVSLKQTKQNESKQNETKQSETKQTSKHPQTNKQTHQQINKLKAVPYGELVVGPQKEKNRILVIKGRKINQHAF